MNDIEVNNSKDLVKILKTIFLNPEISKAKSNELIVDWLGRLKEIDSVFLNQLVFFSISSNTQIWTVETFKVLKSHFEKMLKSVNTLEIALDSWILLLKAQTKNLDCVEFGKFVNILSDQVRSSFIKYRGEEVDQIWERIFTLTQLICNSCSDRERMVNVSDLASKALDQLNDFK